MFLPLVAFIWLSKSSDKSCILAFELSKISQPLWSLINFFLPSTTVNMPLVLLALISDVVVYAFCFLYTLSYSPNETLSVAPLNFNSSPNGLSSSLPLYDLFKYIFLFCSNVSLVINPASTYSCATSVINFLDSLFNSFNAVGATFILVSPCRRLCKIFCSSSFKLVLIFFARKENFIAIWFEKPCASAFNFLKSFGKP